jgi:hypothetical protein
VNRKSTLPIPEAIVQLQRQLDQFRSTQPRRTKLPEALWQAAVELARQCGISPVAHPLRLDYIGLKPRQALSGDPDGARGPRIPAGERLEWCGRARRAGRGRRSRSRVAERCA